MIHSVTVVNYLGESIKMELRRPEKSGFLITNISGLGPPKATINSTENSTDDGSVFNSSRASPRNIVMSITLFPAPTIEDTRHLSYKYFPIKKQVTLIIETDNRTCEISGYVESNVPDIFSKEESIQISIICNDPYFYSYGEDGTNVVSFGGIEDGFEFPFSNESLTQNLIEFGLYHSVAQQIIYYVGDAEIGLTIYIHASGPATNISIYNTGTREALTIDTEKLKTIVGSDIAAGDEIIISTVKRNKRIFLLRNGEYINILNCLDKNTDWFQLSKGDNVFAYTAASGMENLQMSIENKTIFEGV